MSPLTISGLPISKTYDYIIFFISIILVSEREKEGSIPLAMNTCSPLSTILK